MLKGGMVKVLVIHGPNLNMLGKREPEHYGDLTLEEIDARIAELAAELGMEAECFQSNSEAAIVDRIQSAQCQCIIINPAAFTHTSISIRDAILATGIPAIEVHLSNIHRREEFRRHSYVAGVALGQISGFGADGYMLALRAARSHLQAAG